MVCCAGCRIHIRQVLFVGEDFAPTIVHVERLSKASKASKVIDGDLTKAAANIVIDCGCGLTVDVA
jgi:hypothetical protein